MITDTACRTDPLQRGDPRTVGRYQLTGRLGSGGMGVVYLARAHDGRHVAVKLVHADHAEDEDFRRRFRSEVSRAREVPSFCTAAVIDADLDHDPPYLVFEYVDGPSLAEVVEQHGPLTSGGLHSLAIGTATALAAIHGAGVIHRDVKPRNVLLPAGSPKVIDFGIARALNAASQHTTSDQMLGTVAYMAPERFEAAPGTPLTPAADIFAWGVVLGYAATGRTPFHGDSPAATAGRILTQPPNLDGLDEPLRGLVRQALAKDPADRPTAEHLVNQLLTGATPARSPASEPRQPAPRQVRRLSTPVTVARRPSRTAAAYLRAVRLQGAPVWRWIVSLTSAFLVVGVITGTMIAGHVEPLSQLRRAAPAPGSAEPIPQTGTADSPATSSAGPPLEASRARTVFFVPSA